MECPVCWDTLASEDLPTVSTPCGHLFHQKCLETCIEQEARRKGHSTTVAECPSCNVGFELTDRECLEHMVPAALRRYFNPPIRRVYLNGMPIDPESDAEAGAATDFEIQQLRCKLEAADAARRSAEGTISELRSLLQQEQSKFRELQRERNSIAEQRSRAAAEAEKYKQQVQLWSTFSVPGSSRGASPLPTRPPVAQIQNSPTVQPPSASSSPYVLQGVSPLPASYIQALAPPSHYDATVYPSHYTYTLAQKPHPAVAPSSPPFNAGPPSPSQVGPSLVRQQQNTSVSPHSPSSYSSYIPSIHNYPPPPMAPLQLPPPPPSPYMHSPQSPLVTYTSARLVQPRDWSNLQRMRKLEDARAASHRQLSYGAPQRTHHSVLPPVVAPTAQVPMLFQPDM